MSWCLSIAKEIFPNEDSLMEAQVPRPTEELDASFPELAAEEPSDIVATVREGLPTERFDVLREMLDVSSGTLAEVVGITQSTLSRRRKRGTFDKDESERILRVARLVARAMDVLDGLENARKWLTEPARGLGGERPLSFADTEPGAREVERLLIRLERGVYS
jgi:putative toxin-antitoxin system antitoxin component, TIGR02293 family